MHKRLYSFLSRFRILYDLQFGFRAGHSTSLALIDIVERIKSNMDNGDHVIGIYLDLQKAFDTVDHKILLSKLAHYGIRGMCNKWFDSYLSGRQQYVSVNNTQSELKEITVGVPQGSVLGPLLFLIYVNDIARAISEPDITTMLFADDTNVFVKGRLNESMQKAQSAMTQLSKWFIDKKLSLSVEKTQFSIFHKGKQKIPEEFNKMRFSNHEIRRVDSAKYLGVILDEKLSWQAHLSSLNTQLVKIASTFKLIARVIPDRCKKQLYFAYAQSKIQYGIEVIGLANTNRLKKIQTMQNKILKILYKLDWYTPTNTIYNNLTLLKVKDMHRFQVMQFVFKQRQNLLPDTFKDYFILNSDIHQYRTRQSGKIHAKKAKTAFGSNTIKVSGAKLYNNLPNHVTNCQTLSSFKKYAKKHLLLNYM